MRLVKVMALLAAVSTHCFAFDLVTHTVKGDPRTFGVDFQIGRPKEWVERPSAQKLVLATFWSTAAGPGDCMEIAVGSKVATHAMTAVEFKSMFTLPYARTFVRRMTQRLGSWVTLSGQPVVLDDFEFPAGYFEYLMRPQQTREPVDVRVYVIYVERTILEIQFYFLQPPGPIRLRSFDRELDQIVRSLERLPPS
jgi:hypothetical protein